MAGKKSKLKTIVIVMVAVVLVGAFASAGKGEGGNNSPSTQEPAGTQAEQQDDSVPAEYKTALGRAEAYSSTMHMSKQAIYDQLTSAAGDKYSPEAAQYAVDNLQADYNANALEKAKQYQSQMNMSPEAIRQQLTSSAGEKFTQQEADYAIANL